MKLVPLITPRTHLIFRDHEIAAQRSPPPARASRCLGPEWAAHYLLCFHLLEAHTSHNNNPIQHSNVHLRPKKIILQSDHDREKFSAAVYWRVRA